MPHNVFHMRLSTMHKPVVTQQEWEQEQNLKQEQEQEQQQPIYNSSHPIIHMPYYDYLAPIFLSQNEILMSSKDLWINFCLSDMSIKKEDLKIQIRLCEKHLSMLWY